MIPLPPGEFPMTRRPLAFALALSFRAYQAAGTDDLDAMRVTEK